MDDQNGDAPDPLQSFLAFTRAVIARYLPDLESTPDEPEARRDVSPKFLRPRHMVVLGPLWKELAQLDEARRMVEAHDKSGRYYYTSSWSHGVGPEGSLVWNRVLENLTQAVAAVIQYYGIDPSDADVTDIYTRFMDSWLSRKISYYIISPMFNLRVDDYIRQYSIGNNFNIKLLNREDHAIFPELGISYIVPTPTMNDPWLGLTCEQFTVDAGDPRFDSFIEDMRIVVWAMRLVKSGYVSAPYLFAHALGPSVDVEHHATILNTHQDIEARRLRLVELEEKRRKVAYVLDDVALVKINEMYDHLQVIRGMQTRFGGLEFALRRFNLAFSRNTEEDRLVDLVVALDSALVHDRGDLTKKVSHRGANLLALEGYAAATVEGQLRALYVIRSSIVHDGKLIQDCPEMTTILNMQNAEEVTALCFEYTRVVVRRFVTAIHEYITKPGTRPQTGTNKTDTALFAETLK